MTKKKISRIPFEETHKHYVKVLGLDRIDAMDRVQRHYDNFKSRNQKLIERQDDQANTTQISLITQTTLLATAVLTISAAFFGSLHESFTPEQTWILIILAGFELVSLSLGMVEYIVTLNFHHKWALTYYKIDQEVETKIEDASIEQLQDLKQIESKNIDKIPNRTPQWISIMMVASGLIGLWLFFLLVCAYFLDVPFYNSTLIS